jgi:hypothetical protein
VAKVQKNLPAVNALILIILEKFFVAQLSGGGNSNLKIS